MNAQIEIRTRKTWGRPRIGVIQCQWPLGLYFKKNHRLQCFLKMFNCVRTNDFSMHEWALAEAVIKAASDIAEKEKFAKVTEVNVKIGELQQVEREILQFALQQLKPANFKNTKFKTTRAKTQLKCRNCSNTWKLQKQKLDPAVKEAIHFVPEAAHSYIKCPRCGSPDFEITQGRGIWLQNIKGTR